MISESFLVQVTDILGDTATGLTGNEIAKYCLTYASEYSVDIPYPKLVPFPQNLPNKRTALLENLKSFSQEQQFRIIKELCELEKFQDNARVQELYNRLLEKYSGLEISDKSVIKTPTIISNNFNETSIENKTMTRGKKTSNKIWRIIGIIASIATIISVIHQIMTQSGPNNYSMGKTSSVGQKGGITAEVSSVGQSGGITAGKVEITIPNELKNGKNLACSFHIEVMNNLDKLKKLQNEFGSDDFNCQKYNFIFDDFYKFGSSFKEYDLTIQSKNFSTFLRDICSLNTKEKILKAIGSGEDVIRMLEKYYGCKRYQAPENVFIPVSGDTITVANPIASGDAVEAVNPVANGNAVQIKYSINE